MGKTLQTRLELRNIRLTNYGYQVVVTRLGIQISRCFTGFSEASLEEAKRFRDERLPAGMQERANPIPAHVLEALKLSIPVKGIVRVPSRSAYRVGDSNGHGKRVGRYFYYRHLSEVEAYAAAIVFLQERLER